MTVYNEVTLTAGREIRRNLRSTKGIVMFVLFLLGGLIPSLIQVFVLRLSMQSGMASLPPEMQQQGLLQTYEALYSSKEIATYLVKCPLLLFGLFRGTLFFVPLLTLLVGFDQIAGELQHRTFRYAAGRASRGSLVVGKALGVWAVIALMVLVLHTVVWIALITQGLAKSTDVLSWGGRLWLFSALYAAAYVGLTMLISSLFRTPVLALFVGFGATLFVGLVRLLLEISEKTKWATWAFPGSYDQLLVSPNVIRVLSGGALLMVWGALCTTAAVEIVGHKDL